MTTRRDLVVGLMLDGRDFSRGADRATNRMRQFSAETRRFGTTANAGFGKASRGLLELSRGAEDFAVSFGTGGIAGGLRGAANNISQFAAMMNPLAGAFAGLGIAAVSMWMAYNKGADQAVKKTKDFRKEIDESKNSIKNFIGEETFGRLNRLGVPGARNMDLGEITGRVDELFKKRQEIDQELRANQRETLRLLSPEGVTRDLLPMFRPDMAGEALSALGRQLSDVPENRRKPLEEITKRNRELLDQRQRAVVEENKLRPLQERLRRENSFREIEKLRSQPSELEEAVKAEMERERELRAERNRRAARGRILDLHRPEVIRDVTDASSAARLPQLATKGSAEAAKAIAEAKNQSSIQKAQLDELKAIKQQLQEASEAAQGDIVVESFSNVA